MPEESAAEAVAGYQGPHSESRSQTPADVSDPPVQRVEERPVEWQTLIPRSRIPVAVEVGQAGDESSYSVSPLVTPWGIALLESEKAEALTDTLETHFQRVVDPSVLVVIEMVDGVLRSYFQTPASEPKLINPDEVREVIRSLKFGKARGPNGIPNRALKHVPQRAVSLLVQILKTIILTHHFPSLWKHAREASILKPGKDPTLPS